MSRRSGLFGFGILGNDESHADPYLTTHVIKVSYITAIQRLTFHRVGGQVGLMDNVSSCTIPSMPGIDIKSIEIWAGVTTVEFKTPVSMISTNTLINKSRMVEIIGR
jgi:hypothetical protein